MVTAVKDFVWFARTKRRSLDELKMSREGGEGSRILLPLAWAGVIAAAALSVSWLVVYA